METSINAGRLNQRLEVQELAEAEPGVWTWKTVRRTWAQVEQSTRRNLFSAVGIGARGAELILRRQELTLHNALVWGGRHLFLTAIRPEGRLHLRVEAALVTVDTVQLHTDEETVERSFPGILTEKYARHGQEWPMSVNQLGLVLVTPKPVALEPGRLVQVRGHCGRSWSPMSWMSSKTSMRSEGWWTCEREGQTGADGDGTVRPVLGGVAPGGPRGPAEGCGGDGRRGQEGAEYSDPDR